MRIRPATPDDAVALCEVFQAAAMVGGTQVYGEDAAQAWARSSSPAGMEAEIAHAGKQTWVAEGADGVVGFATLHGHDIDFCYVAPAATGQGIGRMLMEHVEAGARAACLAGLEVVASRNAVAFYEALGFHRTATVTRPIGGRVFPCTVMRKAL